MGGAATIEKTCTVTRKGQTTLPLAVRQVLGVPQGGRISVRVEGRKVMIEAVEEEHRDPAIGAFLNLIEADIAAGRHVGTLPDDLVEALTAVLDDIDVDLDDSIAGEICL
jgi:antitoxin PrlF